MNLNSLNDLEFIGRVDPLKASLAIAPSGQLVVTKKKSSLSNFFSWVIHVITLTLVPRNQDLDKVTLRILQQYKNLDPTLPLKPQEKSTLKDGISRLQIIIKKNGGCHAKKVSALLSTIQKIHTIRVALNNPSKGSKIDLPTPTFDNLEDLLNHLMQEEKKGHDHQQQILDILLKMESPIKLTDSQSAYLSDALKNVPYSWVKENVKKLSPDMLRFIGEISCKTWMKEGSAFIFHSFEALTCDPIDQVRLKAWASIFPVFDERNEFAGLECSFKNLLRQDVLSSEKIGILEENLEEEDLQNFIRSFFGLMYLKAYGSDFSKALDLVRRFKLPNQCRIWQLFRQVEQPERLVEVLQAILPSLNLKDEQVVLEFFADLYKCWRAEDSLLAEILEYLSLHIFPSFNVLKFSPEIWRVLAKLDINNENSKKCFLSFAQALFLNADFLNQEKRSKDHIFYFFNMIDIHRIKRTKTDEKIHKEVVVKYLNLLLLEEYPPYIHMMIFCLRNSFKKEPQDSKCIQKITEKMSDEQITLFNTFFTHFSESRILDISNPYEILVYSINWLYENHSVSNQDSNKTNPLLESLLNLIFHPVNEDYSAFLRSLSLKGLSKRILIDQANINCFDSDMLFYEMLHLLPSDEGRRFLATHWKRIVNDARNLFFKGIPAKMIYAGDHSPFASILKHINTADKLKELLFSVFIEETFTMYSNFYSIHFEGIFRHFEEYPWKLLIMSDDFSVNLKQIIPWWCKERFPLCKKVVLQNWTKDQCETLNEHLIQLFSSTETQDYGKALEAYNQLSEDVKEYLLLNTRSKKHLELCRHLDLMNVGQLLVALLDETSQKNIRVLIVIVLKLLINKVELYRDGPYLNSFNRVVDLAKKLSDSKEFKNIGESLLKPLDLPQNRISFRSFYNQLLYSDVQILMGQETFNGHRLILNALPELKTYLSGNNPEIIPNDKIVEFKSLLRKAYQNSPVDEMLKLGKMDMQPISKLFNLDKSLELGFDQPDFSIESVPSGKKFSAHKLILYASDLGYFKKLFSTQFQENTTGILSVMDEDFEVVQQIIEDVYRGIHREFVIDPDSNDQSVSEIPTTSVNTQEPDPEEKYWTRYYELLNYYKSIS
ncbi:MAG: hypothetical protein BGO14_10370 [Chlamydiales bacterium 38-26]|nr:BTB/POZ domain-containing protein [Chlamydiales bacterium]OJV11362.1 MAG: hypothetical protein BGO14_10370 [Chlamydiales bacterium 38-26]